jgi:hypothetical protein
MSERPENKRPPAKSLRIRSWHWSNAFLTINQASACISRTPRAISSTFHLPPTCI